VVAIPELMRLLMDQEDLGWEDAWGITIRVFAYTNHTIMAEALEKWPIDLFSANLPRIYKIIEEIDRRHQEELRQTLSEDWEKRQRMSIVSEGMIHMARLALVTCFP